MSSEKDETFYRLFQFSCNTSVNVTRAFTKWNVLKDFENSFEKFLEAHKHAIYHLWCNTVKCCQCSNFQSTIRSSLGKENFKKLYNIDENNTKGHFIKRKSKVVQQCVCHLSVNTQCSLNTLDITMIYTLLINCANLSSTETTWLTCIKDIRNKIAHAPCTAHYEKLRLDNWWTKLEGAVLGLASKVSQEYYEESIKENIYILKNLVPTASQLSDITERIKAEHAKFQDQLLHQQNNFCDKLEGTVRHMLQQNKDEILIEVRNLLINVKLQDVPPQPDQSSSSDVLSAEHQAARSSDMHTDQSSLEDSDKLYVEWRIANPPEAWRVEQMKTEIDNMSASWNQRGFNVEFVHIGSLVIHTSVPKHVLLDRTNLKSEIKTFLEKVLEVCNIDTDKHEKIEIDFTVKNRISDAVSPKDNTGIKKEVTQYSKDGDDSVQCPLCHNCCKECEENREKTKRVEKYNRKLKNDVEKFYIRFQKTNSMFDEFSMAKDIKVLEPSSKRMKLDTDTERFKAEDREKKADRKEVDEEAECDICKTTDSEENNDMVFCDGCNVCVHQSCYGIRRVPRGKWYCKPCSENVKPECVLCPNTGGAMTKTSKGTTWAHVVCALWIREVKIENTKDMEPILDMDKIPPRRWTLTCCLCKKKAGACIQCDTKNCKKSFHVTCAFKNNFKMEEILATENTSYTLKLYCQIHSNQGSQKKKPKRKPKAVRPRKRQRKCTEKTEAKQILDVQSVKKISTDVPTEVTTEKGGEAPQKGE